MLNYGMLKDNDFDILNGSNVKWDSNAHYRSMLAFSMAVAEFLDNIGDMKFINTLPMAMKEFHQQSSFIKDKYVGMLKSQYAHFADKNDEVITGVGVEKLDKYHQESLDSIKRDNPEEIKILLSSMMMGIQKSRPEDIAKTKEKYSVRYKTPAPDDEEGILKHIDALQQQIASAKEKLPKQEFRTLEECALEMEKRYKDNKFKKLRDAFRWAVDNCTITEGKPLVRWNQLEKALERAKDSGRDIEIPERIKRNL